MCGKRNIIFKKAINWGTFTGSNKWWEQSSSGKEQHNQWAVIIKKCDDYRLLRTVITRNKLQRYSIQQFKLSLLESHAVISGRHTDAT